MQLESYINMTFEDFRRATLAQTSGFWAFITSGTVTLSNLNITTSGGNIKIVWSDGTPSDTVSSGQNISHTYTL